VQAAELVESLDLQADGALADDRLAVARAGWPLEPDSWPRRGRWTAGPAS
jgi:hypothetical protein